MPTSRTPADPPHDPERYPAQGASDLRDLAKYLSAVAETYTEAARVASSTGDYRLQKVARATSRGRKQAENVQRLVAEFAMNQGLTLRESARLFPVSHTTTYQWRFAPLAEEDLSY